MESIFGDVISRYTRKQAIEDGVLVDVSTVAREAGFTVPVAMTALSWSQVVRWPRGAGSCQDEGGRLWDVVWMAACAIRSKVAPMHGERMEFEFMAVPHGETVAKAHKLHLHSGPGDKAEHVITIMLPEED